jgi:tripartite-type tricarboxylate transporter receptor subunit TctC
MRKVKQWMQVAVFGIAIALAATSPLLAQAWPQRTVRVIVPNPAGVGMDLVARIFAERLSARWGHPVIIENLPGADGIAAVREFVSRRDNHTLLYSFAGPITINPILHDKLPYDPARDLVSIASTSDNFLAIAVSQGLNINSLAELDKLARSRPGKLTWAATPGLPYYAFAAFQMSTGSEMVQASYRDFNQAIADLGEGRIDAVAAGVTPLLSQAQTGKIKLLAFINPARSTAAPEVPTVTEAGYPQLTFSAVTGFFGWRDMSRELRERIASDVRAIAAEPSVQERLTTMGSAARGSTPSQFDQAIDEQRAKVAEIAKTIATKAKQ